MTFIRFKIQSVEYFDCYLKVQQHFHLEKTDNVRPRKKNSHREVFYFDQYF